MAKKTKKYNYLDKTIKDWGNIVVNGMDLLKEKREYKTLSISPAIDIALGGGIKEGSWLMLTGDPKSGKTTTALQFAANCQKEGRPVIYLDAEGRMKAMNFDVDGLDPTKMEFIRPEDKPLPAEVFLASAQDMMTDPENHGAVLIIDSISSLIPEKELTGDMTPGRAGLPKIMSIFTKKMGQILPRQKGVIVCITHYIANTAGFGKAKLADGGNKIQYQADTRMEIASGGEKRPAIKPWEDKNGNRIGQEVNWKIICSSMGAPGQQVQSWIRYGYGIDKIQEILMLSQDLGLIDRAGAWFSCVFMNDCKDLAKEINPDLNTDNEQALEKAFKFQGQDKLYLFLSENPKLIQFLESSIKGMLS